MPTTNDNLRETSGIDHAGLGTERGAMRRLFVRVRTIARRVTERVRKALGTDDNDLGPPGFNGMMLVV